MTPFAHFTRLVFLMLRSVWADHADHISRAYSGSGALKTDFTRTGVRTKQGLWMDGQNSTLRYLKNNYFDGDRQVKAIISETVVQLATISSTLM